MNREEQLVYCKKCTNRKMNMQQGLLCGLTGAKAEFTGECAQFSEDETVKVHVGDTQALNHEVFLDRVSTETLVNLRKEQNLPMALLTGSSVGLLAAVLWAAITVTTEYQIGFMAIAIGALVGISMRYTGKGVDPIFGIFGGLIAVISCALGNFLSIIGFVASYENLGYIETLLLFDYSQLFPIMQETFSAIDLLFYGFAAFEGYKFSFRRFTEKGLSEIN